MQLYGWSFVVCVQVFGKGQYIYIYIKGVRRANDMINPFPGSPVGTLDGEGGGRKQGYEKNNKL